jgi:hypothetical protein
VIEWSDKEKKIVMESPTSHVAVNRYFEEFPSSNRTRSSIYTYWWWKKQQEKEKKFEESFSKPMVKIINESINVIRRAVVEKVGKEIVEEIEKKEAWTTNFAAPTKPYSEVVHAKVVDNDVIEVNDMVKFSRTPDAPVGIVVSIEARRNIPILARRMKVRFGNYYVRDVYICDYKIVSKGGK